ncbi:MAG: hypothetical protein Q9160_008647 [Pyrenula sp. 1 TL-2023]
MSNLNLDTPNEMYPGPSLPTPDHIRLLILRPQNETTRIECKLVVTELHAAPEYEALSYTWGDYSASRSIRVTTSDAEEQRELLVTSNCFSALNRLRLKAKPRTIWIDALCIDQSNLSEKSHQVTLMSKIYSQATNVVIYLGEATENIDLAIDFIVECDSPTAKTSSLSFPKSRPLIQALNSLFRRPWFTRVWVLQEAILPSRGIVYCGERALDWSAIKDFNDWNTSKRWVTQLPFVVSMSKQSFTNGKPRSIMLKALLRARHCGATNPRDKVYALLPLIKSFGHQFALAPNYGDALAKVYTDCAKKLLADCGSEILYAVQGGSRLEYLPSWVPDWSTPPRRSILGSFESVPQSSFWTSRKQVDIPLNFQVLTSQSIDPEIKKVFLKLRVSGYLVAQIKKIGSIYLAGQGPFPLSEWRALVIDDECVSSVARAESVYRDGNSSMIAYHFHEVIGAAGFAYPNALRLFVEKEKDARAGGTDVQPRGGKSENGAFDGSWDSAIRNMGHERSGENIPEGAVLPYNDIPFHLAGGYLPPSYSRYVQSVLKNCHSRRFFITNTGYMGIAPEEAQVDDQIYICVGATIPFALRHVQEASHEHRPEQFHLIGECYVETAVWRDLEARSDMPQYLDVV